ncbi:hypothetical protein ACTXT7_007859 [Hymenolepis weldensis]
MKPSFTQWLVFHWQLPVQSTEASVSFDNGISYLDDDIKVDEIFNYSESYCNLYENESAGGVSSSIARGGGGDADSGCYQNGGGSDTCGGALPPLVTTLPMLLSSSNSNNNFVQLRGLSPNFISCDPIRQRIPPRSCGAVSLCGQNNSSESFNACKTTLKQVEALRGSGVCLVFLRPKKTSTKMKKSIEEMIGVYVRADTTKVPTIMRMHEVSINSDGFQCCEGYAADRTPLIPTCLLYKLRLLMEFGYGKRPYWQKSWKISHLNEGKCFPILNTDKLHPGAGKLEKSQFRDIDIAGTPLDTMGSDGNEEDSRRFSAFFSPRAVAPCASIESLGTTSSFSVSASNTSLHNHSSSGDKQPPRTSATNNSNQKAPSPSLI